MVHKIDILRNVLLFDCQCSSKHCLWNRKLKSFVLFSHQRWPIIMRLSVYPPHWPGSLISCPCGSRNSVWWERLSSRSPFLSCSSVLYEDTDSLPSTCRCVCVWSVRVTCVCASCNVCVFDRQILFQVLIILSGNYNFFNILTITLCLSLLDDQHVNVWLFRSPPKTEKSTDSQTQGIVKSFFFTVFLQILLWYFTCKILKAAEICNFFWGKNQ